MIAAHQAAVEAFSGLAARAGVYGVVPAAGFTIPTVGSILSGLTIPTGGSILSGFTIPTGGSILSGFTIPTGGSILSGFTIPTGGSIRPVIVAPAGAVADTADLDWRRAVLAGHPGVVGAGIAVKDVAVAGLGGALDNLGAALRAAGRYTEAIAAHQAAVEAFSGLAARAGVYGIVPAAGFTIPTGGSIRPVIVAPAGAVADTADLDWRRAVLAGHPGVVGAGAGIAVKDVAVAGLGGALDNLGAALRAAGRYTEAIAAHQAAVEAFSGLAARAGVYGIVPAAGFTIPTGGSIRPVIVAPAGAVADTADLDWRRAVLAGHPGVVGAGAGIAVKDVAVAGLGGALDNLGAALRAAGRYTEAIAAHQAAVEAFSGLAARAGVYGIVPAAGFTIPTGGSIRPVIVAPAGAVADTADLDWRRAVLAGHPGVVGAGAGIAVKDVAVAGLGGALDNLGAALRAAGRYTEAIAAHQAAVEAFSGIKDVRGEALALENLEKTRAERLANDSDAF